MIDISLTNFMFSAPFWIAYSGILIVIWRLIAGHLAYKYPYAVKANSGEIGDPDWTYGFWGGLGLTLFWPMAVVGISIYMIFSYWPKELTTPVEKEGITVREERAKQEHYKQLAARTEQQELENGIDGTSHLEVEPYDTGDIRMDAHGNILG